MVTFCIIAVIVCSPIIMFTSSGDAQELATIITLCIDAPVAIMLWLRCKYARTYEGRRKISKRKCEEEKNHNDYGFIDFTEK